MPSIEIRAFYWWIIICHLQVKDVIRFSHRNKTQDGKTEFTDLTMKYYICSWHCK